MNENEPENPLPVLTPIVAAKVCKIRRLNSEPRVVAREKRIYLETSIHERPTNHLLKIVKLPEQSNPLKFMRITHPYSFQIVVYRIEKLVLYVKNFSNQCRYCIGPIYGRK